VQCMWHKGESVQFDIAHIIPEALGCPDELVFRDGEECKSCNNRLAYVDRALIDSFDVLRFQVGHPTKTGKMPEITGRPNLHAFWNKSSPIIEVNRDKVKVSTTSGRVLTPGKGKEGGVIGRLVRNGLEAEITLDVPIGHQLLLSRALHKVALASLVKLISHQHVLDPTYDPVRDFVLNGVGSREVLMLFPQGKWSYMHVVGPVYSSPERYTGMELLLCGFMFCLDLSPKQAVVPKLKEQVRLLYGENIA
jgi:hypothetical protein